MANYILKASVSPLPFKHCIIHCPQLFSFKEDVHVQTGEELAMYAQRSGGGRLQFAVT